MSPAERGFLNFIFILGNKIFKNLTGQKFWIFNDIFIGNRGFSEQSRTSDLIKDNFVHKTKKKHISMLQKNNF